MCLLNPSKLDFDPNLVYDILANWADTQPEVEIDFNVTTCCVNI